MPSCAVRATPAIDTPVRMRASWVAPRGRQAMTVDADADGGAAWWQA
jgi:hypothetical protein